MTHFSVEPGAASAALDAAFTRLDQLQFAEALWSRRLDVWTQDPAVQQKIANRLGWLEAIEFVGPHLPRLQAFAAGIKASGLSDVVLLGMGGSSLAPEVFHRVFGRASELPRFHMLDSTDPDAVRNAIANAATSLFIVASKSGTTIEPNSMAAAARRRVEAGGIKNWGSRFIAITDENTELHRRAQNDGFRDIFINPSDVGGRYSALTLFGMVPAALMEVPLGAVIDRARAMVNACRSVNPRANPGLALGALIGASASIGRDKLTLLVPKRLASFGLWVEQLVAESTGKQGKGIVPIAGETPDAAAGVDRVVVAVRVGAEGPDTKAVDRVRAAGVPLMTLEMPDIDALGAEFFRWEIATATAGRLLEINPFDEPNVRQAKDATRALLRTYTTRRELPIGQADAEHDGMRITLSQAARERLGSSGAETFLSLLTASDYFGLLAYVPPDHGALAPVLEDLRNRVAIDRRCATMFGYGPRYLHSTGQLHKGGPNSGVFVIVTASPEADLQIPGEPYSFFVLQMAQALGDFQSLDSAGRRAAHVHLPDRNVNSFKRLAALLLRPDD